MVEPTISSLLEKVDSKYTLCILVGKRARQLTNGVQKLSMCNSHNMVTVATNEISEKRISYIRTKNEINTNYNKLFYLDNEI